MDEFDFFFFVSIRWVNFMRDFADWLGARFEIFFLYGVVRLCYLHWIAISGTGIHFLGGLRIQNESLIEKGRV